MERLTWARSPSGGQWHLYAGDSPTVLASSAVAACGDAFDPSSGFEEAAPDVVGLEDRCIACQAEYSRAGGPRKERVIEWAQALAAMGGGDLYAHIKVLIGTIVTDDEIQARRIGFLGGAPPYRLEITTARRDAPMFSGEGANPFEAAGDLLVQLEDWRRQLG